MNGTKKRKFIRPVSTREYRKVITIFPEGERTENIYFVLLKQIGKNVNVIIKKGDKKTEPNQVLRRAKKYIKENGVSKNEQVWLVIDVDNRPASSFKECVEWEKSNAKYHVAISNPKFEYWLLMHFETGDGIRNANDCMVRLMKYIPNYNKTNISHKDITKENCVRAVSNGKRKHINIDVLQNNCSTVYRLVDEIIN